MEKTYIMLKPDALQRKLAGQIISRIEEKGFVIEELKTIMLTEEILKEHYSHIADKPFFPEIVEYMTRGPVVGMVVAGDDVIEGMRRLMGPTEWEEALPGTIRGDFGLSTGENIIHGSDAVETAEIEINRFMR